MPAGRPTKYRDDGMVKRMTDEELDELIVRTTGTLDPEAVLERIRLALGELAIRSIELRDRHGDGDE